MKLSILIPCHPNELYLDKTVESIKDNATGEYEILVGIDEGKGMRATINGLVEKSTGDFLLKLDAHVMVAKGFDEQLIKDHKPNWVQVPRRKRLDAKNWAIINDGRPDVDYEYIMFQTLSQGIIWATPDDKRTEGRKEILIDDTMHFQGSCWFMTKEWFKKLDLFNEKGYGSFAQEPEEIILKTLQNGGEIKTNKNTYYCHLHKSKEERKAMGLNEKDMRDGHEYSFNQWKENKDLVSKFINKFNCPDFKEGWERIWN